MKRFKLKRLLISRLILVGILFFAFFLRAYKLSEVPPALNADEISHGFDAYSILKTGRDQWGLFLPWIFRAYGDYKLPLYIYLSIPSVLIFGLNIFSVRLLSVLSGVGLAWVAYLITKKVTKDENLSLLSSFLTAVAPWSLFLSRVAVEANFGAFLFSFGIYFLVCLFENSKRKHLFLTALFWGLSLHVYNSARILVPLSSVLLGLYLTRKNKVKEAIFFIFILFIFFIPVLFQLFDKTANARFQLVSLIDQGAINEIIEKRVSSQLPSLIVPLVYNRPVYFIIQTGKGYLQNLSPNYLFKRGSKFDQFNLPGEGILYLLTAPFIFLGIIKLIKGKSIGLKIILFWFFLSSLPSALTRDAPHPLRSIFILPSPLIICAVGFGWVKSFLEKYSAQKGRLFSLAFILFIFLSFVGWWQRYFYLYPKVYSQAWQYSYKEAVNYLVDHYPEYSKIFITKKYSEPHEFILFYFPWDPKSYQIDQSKKWDYHSDWYWVDAFDKFEFINDWEVKEKVNCNNQKEKCLLITSPGNYPSGWNKIKAIDFLDGQSAFEILEFGIKD